VKEGTLTFYEYDDPTCTPKVGTKGQGYVATGRGHVGRNETDSDAVDISVITAPVGGGFRTNIDTPSPYCGFYQRSRASSSMRASWPATARCRRPLLV
jgi:hypothetical protein